MSDSGQEVVANRVWFRLLRLQARLNVAIAERLREIGVSVPQCDVLTTLTEREGVTQQELAQRLYVTKGNISGLIDRLETAGFVERRATVGDRRSHAIFLTETGRRIALAGIDIQRGFVEASFGRMPPERIAAFEKMLVDVRDIVREMNALPGRTALRRR
jgi:DNA-binding MarR family transcriptional regulator